MSDTFYIFFSRVLLLKVVKENVEMCSIKTKFVSVTSTVPVLTIAVMISQMFVPLLLLLLPDHLLLLQEGLDPHHPQQVVEQHLQQGELIEAKSINPSDKNINILTHGF